MKEQEIQKNRIRWIDGAKGIAILMVVVVHIAGQMQKELPSYIAFVCAFGNMGVQLFFLLSAYTACLTQISPFKNRNTLLVYYIKKFMRLAPLYWLGIMLYFLMASAGIIFGGPASDYTKWNILANILLINNVFPSAQNNIVPGGWCIGCFSLFYLLFPVLNRFLNSQILLKTACICILGAIITVWFLNFTKLPKQYIYWLIVNQIGIFAIGMLYYKNVKLQTGSYIGLQFLIGCGLVGVTLLLMRVIGQEYVYRHILVSISFVFVLNALRKYEILLPNWLISLGNLSYPIFIIHLAVSWVVIRVIRLQISALPSTLLLFIYVFVIAFISAEIAFILNRFIEKPVLKLVKSLIKKIEFKISLS